MKWMYAFDSEKKHRLEYILTITKAEQKVSSIEISFDCIIQEVEDHPYGLNIETIVLKQEKESGLFHFSTDPTQIKFNIRKLRYPNSNKWVFSIANDFRLNEIKTVGLYALNETRTPKYIDVVHDQSDAITWTYKSPNITVIESDEPEVLITQHVLNWNFDTADLPDGWIVTGEAYSQTNKCLTCESIQMPLVQPVVMHGQFHLSMQVAPSVNTLLTERIFNLDLGILGNLEMLNGGLRFTNAIESKSESKNWSLTNTVFFDTQFKSPSMLEMHSNGNGLMQIVYGLVEMNVQIPKIGQFNQITVTAELGTTLKIDTIQSAFDI